ETHTPGDQQRADAMVEAVATDLLNNYVHALWRDSVLRDRNGKITGFNWKLLVDYSANAATGAARLKSQWIRANIAPSERYVLSVPGSDRYRLPAHDTDEFTNLYLAGDWTNNRMNIGCVEAATMSG